MNAVVGGDVLVLSAIDAAEAAAQAAGVTVREMSGGTEEARVIALLDRIWGRDAGNPVFPSELLRVLGKTGNYIGGAFADGELVGASIGLHASPERLTLHSHISGVVPGRTGRSIGYALKLHQRAWALERRIDTVEWTFDPLLSRNANFNIVKLGALPVSYLEDFYGPLPDAINAGDASDRLLVRWELRSPHVADLAAGTTKGSAPRGDIVVAIPDDIEAIRTTDPVAAREWRRRVREELTALMDQDARIVGFRRRRGYILQLDHGKESPR